MFLNMSRGFGTLGFVIYLLSGLYFINLGFNLITLPEFDASVGMWINIVAGALLVFGGFHFLTKKKKRFREEY